MPHHSSYIALVSLTSGALSVAGYILLKRLLCKSKCKGKKAEQSKIYEEKALLDQYMLFNFAEANDIILSELSQYSDIRNCVLFPRNVALLCRDHCPEIFFSEHPHPRRALDVGCAVGRSCFELSKLFDQVIGIDYSVNFIDHCKKILAEKKIEYECTLEGDLNQKLVYQLDPEVNGDRLSFEVGDACNLREDLGEFDLVLASNLICRLTEPMKFLNRLKTLVKPRKYVIMSTPFTWGAQYTPKENWIGGFVDENSREVNGIDGLKTAMGDSFDLSYQTELPMLIRETRRKFQYTICLITIWQRK